MKSLGIAVLVAVMALSSAALAAAQYPGPGAPVTITPTDANPGVGETITLNIQVTAQTSAIIDESPEGDILASMPVAPAGLDDARFALQSAPYDCTSGVTGGSGATVSPSSFTTDSSGAAALSLFTGNQPGTLTVSITCGELTGQAVIPVGQAATPPAGATPAPPSTGVGTTSGGSSFPWIAVLAIGVVAVAGAAVAVYRSTRSGAISSGATRP